MIIALVVSAVLFYKDSKGNSQQKIIGIIQTTTTNSLDKAREGFIEEIHRQVGDTITFVIENAEGSEEETRAIAERFHEDKTLDAIYAIATPALQSIACIEKKRPVFVAAISKPEDLGILYDGSNVCGMSDKTDIVKHIAMVRELIPGVHNVALMYNPKETNSCIMVDEMRQELERKGLNVFEVEVSNKGDITMKVEEVSSYVDAILIPADNLLTSIMHTFAAKALEYGVPVIACDMGTIEDGALAATSVDYKELGAKTAQVALEVLMVGRNPDEMSVEMPERAGFFVNAAHVTEMGIATTEEIEKSGMIVK